MTISIKTIRDGLSLDIDGHLFLDKILSDLAFVDSVLDTLFRSLCENERLIERNEYIRELENVQKDFIEIVSMALNGDFSFSSELGSFSERLQAIIVRERDNLHETQKLLSAGGTPDLSDIDIVSQDELSELFREDEAEDKN